MLRFVAPIVLLAGCFDSLRPCTLIGCLDAVTVDVGPIANAVPWLGATVRMCREDQCLEVVLPDQLPPPSTGEGDATSGVFRIAAYLTNKDDQYFVNVTLDDASSRLADGDHYTLQILDSTSTPLFERDWTASYTESYPNGDCGQRCVSDEIAFTVP